MLSSSRLGRLSTWAVAPRRPASPIDHHRIYRGPGLQAIRRALRRKLFRAPAVHALSERGLRMLHGAELQRGPPLEEHRPVGGGGRPGRCTTGLRRRQQGQPAGVRPLCWETGRSLAQSGSDRTLSKGAGQSAAAPTAARPPHIHTNAALRMMTRPPAGAPTHRKRAAHTLERPTTAHAQPGAARPPMACAHRPPATARTSAHQIQGRASGSSSPIDAAILEIAYSQ